MRVVGQGQVTPLTLLTRNIYPHTLTNWILSHPN